MNTLHIEYCSFGSTESDQDHDYIQVMTRDDPGEGVLIFVGNNFLLAIHMYR